MNRTTLILARHGNTFTPEQTPVWVGARTDLPLVAKGLTQAQALAEALHSAKLLPTALVTGPLQRTQQTAAAIATTLSLPPPHIDPRLTEIDYGDWEGKTTAAIIATGGNAALTAWETTSTFPQQANWTPDEPTLAANIASFLADIQSGTTIAVTSNGILRFFARAAANAADFPQTKVSTGHACILTRASNNLWQITGWNLSPASLTAFL